MGKLKIGKVWENFKWGKYEKTENKESVEILKIGKVCENLK